MDGIPADVSATSWTGVLFLALLPTGLATLILTFVIRRAGPPFLSLVNYQVPVWAVLIGVTVLGEPLPGHFLAALATILDRACHLAAASPAGARLTISTRQNS